MTARGKIVFTIIVIVVAFIGISRWGSKSKPGQDADGKPQAEQAAPGQTGPELKLAETQTEVPRLDAAGTYTPKDNIVDIELSEYAGYAGLIVANGGLEPNDN